MTEDGVNSPKAAFEEYFRGSVQDIRRRLSVYLPLLEEAGVRSLAGPVLDLGTGRGEWLALMAEHGYSAVGSDVSERVVAVAREAGFEVAQADALEDLRARQDASLAAVTAFHVVEHIDPRTLGELVAEIHRVLVPGGVIVLETPNPENVTVGLVNFYVDADHVRPVPPPLMEFHARQAGFPLPWIARVNRALIGAPLAEVPSSVSGALEINAVVYALNGLLFAAPDYALVAQKAGNARSPFDVAAFERILGRQPRDLQAHRAVAAEETALRLAAEKNEAEARTAELELVSAASAQRAAEADQRARSAEQAAQQAWEDFATVSDSLSWRVTAPLRAAAALARRFSSSSVSRPHATPKRYAKLAVGHPMRWALAQPRLGPLLDNGLTRVPAVEHKVRIAINETRVVPSGIASAAPTSPDGADLSGLSESARTVVADLERALPGEGR